MRLICFIILSFMAFSCGKNQEKTPEQIQADQDLQNLMIEKSFESWESKDVQISEGEKEDPELNLEQEVDSELPMSMSTFGDSITQAAIAPLRRQDAGAFATKMQLVNMGLSYLFVRNKAADFPAVSWASGLGLSRRVKIGRRTKIKYSYPVKSHALRIKELHKKNSRKFKVYNAAESGAETEDLKDQLKQMLKWSKKELKKAVPDYVTLLIGGNDLCNGFEDKDNETIDKMTSKEVYRQRVYEVVSELLEKGEDNKVLLVAVPKVESLRKIAYNAELLLVDKWLGKILGTGPITKCGHVWEALGGMCKGLLKEDRPMLRSIIANRVIEYNEALSEISDELRAEHGDRIRFSSEIAGVDFDADKLAIDCFHPNIEGQNMISDYSWPDTWWGK